MPTRSKSEGKLTDLTERPFASEVLPTQLLSNDEEFPGFIDNRGDSGYCGS